LVARFSGGIFYLRCTSLFLGRGKIPPVHTSGGRTLAEARRRSRSESHAKTRQANVRYVLAQIGFALVIFRNATDGVFLPTLAMRAFMNYWEIIADNLSKAGWSWGCVTAIDRDGRTIWIADAHRDDGKRFAVRADEKLTSVYGT
jgi:hypothetical protein